MEEKKGKIKGIIIRSMISIAIIGVVLGGLYFLFRSLGYTKMTKEELRNLIEKTGTWGPIVFILASFLQVTFIPIPGAVTIVVGNLLFGPWVSLLYSFIGMFFGSLLAFALGRWLGRPFVNWVVGDKETVDTYLKRLKGKETVLFFFMFLLPMFPDDALCSVAGITPISWPVFIGMQVITRITSILGTLFFMSGEIIPFKGWGIVVLVIVGLLALLAFYICMKKADQINDWLSRIAEKITKHFKHKKKDDENDI